MGVYFDDSCCVCLATIVWVKCHMSYGRTGDDLRGDVSEHVNMFRIGINQ